MRETAIGQPRDEKDMAWAIKSLIDLARASGEPGVVEDVFNDLTVTNATPTLSLDVSTATTADLANFVAGIVESIKSRGTKGTE